ncbi:uncharacterized protein LOC111608800 isoform X2 [Xiphophorus maculatus]|uniref:uncharacterized protein LOC111608800 isoform X2 n=1 Tax=Xiphophorus maculatus TaxID=8083 RepID=UPI000C6E6C13|nr:uncharacterized protein LOC111608800 isoform X2 [Xiphophorus maculatus]
MALLLLYFFLVSGELYSCNAQTTDGNTSPSAETLGNANATAETTVGFANRTAETTVGFANTTAETTVTNVNATVGPGCSDPPILCCAGQNNSCRRVTCYCDQACVTIGDCCSDFKLTCMHFFNSTNSSTPSPPLTETTVSQASETSADYKTSTSTFTDFQSLTLHLKVSLLTRGSINNSVISEALSSYLSRVLLQPTCKNCSLRIKHIVFN